MHSTDKIRSFTLIELLVVIAIIAILAGMLLPSLGSAKGLAVSMSCLNNLRQTSLLLRQYVNDSNGYFPGTEYVKAPSQLYESGNNTYWYDMLSFHFTHTKRWKPLYCPAGPEPNAYLRAVPLYGHYGLNRLLMPAHMAGMASTSSTYPHLVAGREIGGNRVSKLRRAPSAMAAVLDAPRSQIGVDNGMENNVPKKNYISGAGKALPELCASSDLSNSPGYIQDFVRGRHNGSLNISFLDGHTVKMSSKEVGLDFYYAGWYKVNYNWIKTESMFAVW